MKGFPGVSLKRAIFDEKRASIQMSHNYHENVEHMAAALAPKGALMECH